jgi:hypothetical protein
METARDDSAAPISVPIGRKNLKSAVLASKPYYPKIKPSGKLAKVLG